MSDKYIIRNCPSIYGLYNEVCGKSKDEYFLSPCKDCTDCLLKQIVEKCKAVQTKFYDAPHQRYLSPSKAKFAKEILELIEIEECEDEKTEEEKQQIADILKG